MERNYIVQIGCLTYTSLCAHPFRCAVCSVHPFRHLINCKNCNNFNLRMLANWHFSLFRIDEAINCATLSKHGKRSAVTQSNKKSLFRVTLYEMNKLCNWKRCYRRHFSTLPRIHLNYFHANTVHCEIWFFLVKISANRLITRLELKNTGISNEQANKNKREFPLNYQEMGLDTSTSTFTFFRLESALSLSLSVHLSVVQVMDVSSAVQFEVHLQSIRLFWFKAHFQNYMLAPLQNVSPSNNAM